MGYLQWQPVGTADLGSLAKARWLALNIVQWPARIANSYVRGEAWLDRLCLRWNGADAAMVTQPFCGGRLALELRIRTLAMRFLEHDRPVPHTMEPEEHSPAEVEAWLLVELLHRGVKRSSFSKALPYDIPDLMTGDANDYSPASCSAGLEELAAWFGNAAHVFEKVNRVVSKTAKAGPRIECWPQNLTMTCRTGVSDGSANAESVEMGFSPGENDEEEPYFYVASRGHDTEKRNTLAVMKSSAITKDSSPQTAVTAFLHDAISQVSNHSTA